MLCRPQARLSSRSVAAGLQRTPLQSLQQQLLLLRTPQALLLALLQAVALSCLEALLLLLRRRKAAPEGAAKRAGRSRSRSRSRPAAATARMQQQTRRQLAETTHLPVPTTQATPMQLPKVKPQQRTGWRGMATQLDQMIQTIWVEQPRRQAVAALHTMLRPPPHLQRTLQLQAQRRRRGAV